VKTVLMIEESLVHYRLPFFQRLHEELRERQIALRVAYSDPWRENGDHSHVAGLPNEYGLKVRAYRGPGGKLTFQPLAGEALRSDLVIISQENRFVLNHVLISASQLGLQQVAFCGHGRCLHGNRFSEWYKRQTVNWVNWWFSYTKGTTEYLIANGVPAEKITTIFNSVDTNGLRRELDSISESELADLRQRIGLSRSSRVAIFCGTLYEEKGVSFLIETAKRVRVQMPEFHLILIGGGHPNNGAGMDLARNSRWLHYAGPCFGRDKARFLKLADVFLLPGAVGLAILDAFAASLPLITTENPFHGPEIEYLEHGKNGLITALSVPEYAAAVGNLLQDSARMVSMRREAAGSGEKYTIERMVGNFCEGIERCLKNT
jgi:glycosyltransferase involved in cell wall biosynthesis